MPLLGANAKPEETINTETPTLAPRRSLFATVVPPIILPVFMGAADATVVATALPAIASAFGEVGRLSWVVVANLIASTVAAPAYGRLADGLGRRRMMIIALLIFMTAAVACSVAPTFELLLVGRVLQGLGSGGLMTLAQALVGEHVPPRERGSYQGYLSANIVAGSTIGPVVGGFLTQTWGWPAVFLAYPPLCCLAIVLVLRLPRNTGTPGRVSLDVPGVVLLAASVVPLLMAVSQLQKLSPAAVPGIGLLLAAAMAGLTALFWQQRRSAAPLLPLALLKLPAFWRSDVMAACSGGSLTALSTFLPIYFQAVLGATPARAGLMLIPLTAAVSSGSVVTGWLISRTGRTAIFPMCGLMITAVSLIALGIWAPTLSSSQLSIVLAIGGLCQGSAMLTAQVTAQMVGGTRNLGAAAASVQLSRSLGSAFGAAIAGAVLFGVLSVMDQQTAALFYEMVRRGPGVLMALSADHRALVQEEIASAFRGVFLTVACFSCTIVAMAATIPVRRL